MVTWASRRSRLKLRPNKAGQGQLSLKFQLAVRRVCAGDAERLGELSERAGCDLKRDVARALREPEKHAAFVAEQNGRLVGFSSLELAAGAPSRRVASLYASVVLPVNAGVDVEAALIKAKLVRAAALGATHASIAVQNSHSAIEAYRRFGFREVNRPDAREDFVVMQQELRRPARLFEQRRVG